MKVVHVGTAKLSRKEAYYTVSRLLLSADASERQIERQHAAFAA